MSKEIEIITELWDEVPDHPYFNNQTDFEEYKECYKKYILGKYLVTQLRNAVNDIDTALGKILNAIFCRSGY